MLARCVGRVTDHVASAVPEVSCAGVWVMSVGGPSEPLAGGGENPWDRSS